MVTLSTQEERKRLDEAGGVHQALKSYRTWAGGGRWSSVGWIESFWRGDKLW